MLEQKRSRTTAFVLLSMSAFLSLRFLARMGLEAWAGNSVVFAEPLMFGMHVCAALLIGAVGIFLLFRSRS